VRARAALSVTEIKDLIRTLRNLQRDTGLRLRALYPLRWQSPDAPLRGIVVHAVPGGFCEIRNAFCPAQTLSRAHLLSIAEVALTRSGPLARRTAPSGLPCLGRMPTVSSRAGAPAPATARPIAFEDDGARVLLELADLGFTNFRGCGRPIDRTQTEKTRFYDYKKR